VACAIQGKRLIVQWVKQPLLDLIAINERHSLVEAFVDCDEMRLGLQDDCLRRFPDLNRLAKKFSRGKATLEDCVHVYQAVSLLDKFVGCLRLDDGPHAVLLEEVFAAPLGQHIVDFANYRQLIEHTVDLEETDNRQCVSVAAYACMMRQGGMCLYALQEGTERDILFYLVGEEEGGSSRQGDNVLSYIAPQQLPLLVSLWRFCLINSQLATADAADAVAAFCPCLGRYLIKASYNEALSEGRERMNQVCVCVCSSCACARVCRCAGVLHGSQHNRLSTTHTRRTHSTTKTQPLTLPLSLAVSSPPPTSTTKVHDRIPGILKKAARDLGLEPHKAMKLEKDGRGGAFVFRVTRAHENLLRGNRRYTTLETQKSGVKFVNADLQSVNDEYTALHEQYRKEQEKIVAEVLAIAAGYCEVMQTVNGVIANLDVIVSFAHASLNAPIPYVRPTMTPMGDKASGINLTDCR